MFNHNSNRPRQTNKTDLGRPTVYSYQGSPLALAPETTGVRSSASPKKNRRHKMLWRILGVVLILGMFYSLWLGGSPKIVINSQPGTIAQPLRKYQKAANDLWQQSLLNRSKLTVKSDQITQALYDQFPEIDKVRLDISLIGQGVKIELTPDKPVMQLISPNGSFYLNADGKALAQTNNVTANNLPSLPVVQDYSGLTASEGKTILPKSEIDAIRQLQAELLVAKVPIASINLSANEADELDIKLTGQKYYLKFNVNADPQQAVGAYLAVKAKFDSTHQTPSEYIDLRIPEKVFYK